MLKHERIRKKIHHRNTPLGSGGQLHHLVGPTVHCPSNKNTENKKNETLLLLCQYNI
jgi:hypothetical protein